jgi:hypothetical protein
MAAKVRTAIGRELLSGFLATKATDCSAMKSAVVGKMASGHGVWTPSVSKMSRSLLPEFSSALFYPFFTACFVRDLLAKRKKF